MICPLTVVSCKARKPRIIIFQKGVVEMQRMYRILGNRWRIKRAVGWQMARRRVRRNLEVRRAVAHALDVHACLIVEWPYSATYGERPSRHLTYCRARA
jgi:hypothetical protein